MSEEQRLQVQDPGGSWPLHGWSVQYHKHRSKLLYIKQSKSNPKKDYQLETNKNQLHLPLQVPMQLRDGDS
jgi:hypothetical protein